jgi:hypothetical protein
LKNKPKRKEEEEDPETIKKSARYPKVKMIIERMKKKRLRR